MLYAGVLATVNSGFGSPAGLALDSSGNVYISYPYYIGGSVVEVPWTQASGYGTATIVATALGSPFGIAADKNGNIFIAVSGTGPGTNTGAVMEASPPTAGGGWTLTTPVSGLNSPKGVAVDNAGNLYVADAGNQTVIEVPAATGTPVTLANTSTSTNGGDFTPYGVAVDASGNVFVADRGDQYNLGTVDGTVTEIPSGCTAAAAIAQSCQIDQLDSGMHYPEGIAVDANENLFIADYQFGWILELPWMGSAYSSTHPPLFNSGKLAVNSRYYPTGVAVDPSGNVFFSDTANNRVEKGDVEAVDFGAESVSSSSATIAVSFVFIDNTTIGGWTVMTHGATGLDFSDASGGTCSSTGPSASYIVNDGCTVNVSFTPQATGLRSGTLVLQDTSGNVLATAYLHGVGVASQIAFGPGTQSLAVSSGLSLPTGVTVDEGGSVYVSDSGSGSVVKTSGGSQSTVASGLSSPSGVAVDGGGNVYIADSGNHRVVEVPWAGSAYGTQTTVISGLNSPKSVAVDGGGNLYIADSGSRVVVKIPWIVGVYGAPLTLANSTTNGTSFDPVDVAVDGSGNVYIADTGNSQVVKVPWTASGYGASSTVGSGLSSPVGVAVDGIGNVYITDSSNHNVVKVSWTGSNYGAQSTIADLTTNGNGFVPVGVSVTGGGNIYIADAGNSQVVEVDVADPPSLSFASTPVGFSSSDSPKTVTVANNGNLSLVFSTTGGSNPLYPANFSENSSDSNLCAAGTSLSAGASCDVSANFTPSTAGAFTSQIALTNNAFNGGGTQNIGVSGTGTLALSPASLPGGTVGAAYSQNVAATGGSGSYAFSVSSGTLPAGLALSTSGLLSGTPIAGGSFSVTIAVADSNNLAITGSQTYSLNIGAPTITLSPSSLPDTTYGANYSQTLTASGGTPSYSFAVTSGSLPAGISLNSGVLSGTPTPGSFNFTVTATDSSTGTGPYSSSQPYSLLVNQATPALSLACAEVTYDGNAHSCVGTTTGIGGVTVSGTWSYSPASVTAAGSTPVTGTFTSSNSNYAGGTASGTLKIDPATPTLSLACAEVTYDGNPRSCVGTATGIGGVAVSGTWSYSPANVTAVGSTPVTGSFTSSNGNYASGTAIGTLKIDPAKPTLSLTCAEVPYDGNAHFCVGAATGIGGVTVSGTWSYSPTSVTGAGSTLVTGTFTSSNSDYAGGTASGTLKIDQVTPTLSLACPEVIYDGNAHSCVGTATGIGGIAVSGTWSYSPASVTAAGSTPVIGTFISSNPNYASGTASGTLTIDPAAPAISSISPAFMAAGSAAFTLTVNGSGFTANSTIYWGTSAVATQYGNAAQLTAQVTAADIAASGTSMITVQTPAPGGGTSNSLYFEIDSTGSGATAPTMTSTTATVPAGSTASYPVVFPASVISASLSCLNLPSGASCGYSSSSNTVTITTSSTTPAGTYQITLVFAETISGPATAGFFLPVLLLPLALLRRKLGARKAWMSACAGLVLMAASAFCSGCGGRSSPSTPPVNPTHQVMSSSVVSLIVQ